MTKSQKSSTQKTIIIMSKFFFAMGVLFMVNNTFAQINKSVYVSLNGVTNGKVNTYLSSNNLHTLNQMNSEIGFCLNFEKEEKSVTFLSLIPFLNGSNERSKQLNFGLDFKINYRLNGKLINQMFSKGILINTGLRSQSSNFSVYANNPNDTVSFDAKSFPGAYKFQNFNVIALAGVEGYVFKRLSVFLNISYGLYSTKLRSLNFNQTVDCTPDFSFYNVGVKLHL